VVRPLPFSRLSVCQPQPQLKLKLQFRPPTQSCLLEAQTDTDRDTPPASTKLASELETVSGGLFPLLLLSLSLSASLRLWLPFGPRWPVGFGARPQLSRAAGRACGRRDAGWLLLLARLKGGDLEPLLAQLTGARVAHAGAECLSEQRQRFGLVSNGMEHKQKQELCSVRQCSGAQ